MCRFLILFLLLCLVFISKGIGTTGLIYVPSLISFLNFPRFLFLVFQENSWTILEHSLTGGFIPCPHVFTEGRWFLIHSPQWNEHLKWSAHSVFSSIKSMSKSSGCVGETPVPTGQCIAGAEWIHWRALWVEVSITLYFWLGQIWLHLGEAALQRTTSSIFYFWVHCAGSASFSGISSRNPESVSASLLFKKWGCI